MKKGFTMIELIFVIVILGILAAVAIPRLAGTRADAEITSALANLRTFLSDAATFYIAKGSFFEGTPANGNTAASGDYVKFNQFTNVPLYEAQVNGAKINQDKTVKDFVSIAVGGKPCISIALLDPLENSGATSLSSAVVMFAPVNGANSSLCNAVKNAEVIKAITHNVLLNKDGEKYDFIGKTYSGQTVTGAVGVGSSASVYDLNYTPGK